MPTTKEVLQQGRYRVENEIAANDEIMSLFEAVDTVRESPVILASFALDTAGSTPAAQEILRLAFANQANALTEINHDSLVHVYDSFSEDGRHHLILEAIAGDDLATLLDRNKNPFPISDSMNWADQLLDALNYLHSFKPAVIHGNISPRHIILDSAGRVRLSGYMLPGGSVVTTLPANGQAGTELNYSPIETIWQGLDSASQKVITNAYDERSEWILKEPADARTDIYSLGATLYHLATAQKPCDALERSIELLEGRPDPLKAPSALDARIPKEISDVLMKALEVRRENRFDTAFIMRQVLRTALSRVREREAQQPAAYTVPGSADSDHSRADTAQLSETELMREKLREAEEQRQLAEQRAAEAERLLREQTASFSLPTVISNIDSEEDLLGLIENSVPPVSELPAVMPAESHHAPVAVELGTDEQEDAGEDELFPVVEAPPPPMEEEPVVSEAEPEQEIEEPVVSEAEPEQEIEEPAQEPAAPLEPIIAVTVEPDDEAEAPEPSPPAEKRTWLVEPKVFSEPEPHVSAPPVFTEGYTPVEPASSKRVPIIAAAAGLVVFGGIGLWLLMPSSAPSTASDPVPTSAVTNVEPPVQPVPVEQQPQNSFAGEQPADSVEETAAANAAPKPEPAKVSATPKPKKPTPEPAKAPAQKKVTADDLINDN
jgi:serine/threonine protein kinase